MSSKGALDRRLDQRDASLESIDTLYTVALSMVLAIASAIPALKPNLPHRPRPGGRDAPPPPSLRAPLSPSISCLSHASLGFLITELTHQGHRACNGSRGHERANINPQPSQEPSQWRLDCSGNHWDPLGSRLLCSIMRDWLLLPVQEESSGGGGGAAASVSDTNGGPTPRPEEESYWWRLPYHVSSI